MSKTTSDSITLTLADVRGSTIAAAIIKACENSDYLAAGVVGPGFATSGPGSGWTKNFDASDYAKRALSDDHGATGYVDTDDGRLATLEDGELVWSEESVVALDAPDLDEVDTDSETVEAMVKALDSGLCIEGAGDWDKVRALAEVSEDKAIERYDIEIVGESVLYYDDNTRKWYTGPREDLRRLRILMADKDEQVAGDAYSHWCAETTHDEHESEDEAREATAE